MTGIHEVQVGELENRNDDDAVAEFNAIYQRWHEGERDVPLPGGETGNQVLDRYMPVLTDLRMRYLEDDQWNSDIVVVSHGAAIRLTAAVLAGVESNFVLDHHLQQHRGRGAVAGHRRALELRAVGGVGAAVLPGPQMPRQWTDAVESGADPMG